MKSVRKYFFEHLLIAATMLLSVSGFWNIYVGENAALDQAIAQQFRFG